MKEKKAVVYAKGASTKQWSDLILELNLMKKTKTDPVKDFQKQAVEQRVCLFYVADRVKSILEDNKNNNDKMRSDLEEFNDECIHNIGVNALIEMYEY